MKSTVETKIIELVKSGHELAKELHCAESAALVNYLATQLEVQFARSNALAAENAALKRAAEFATAPDMWVEQPDGMLDYLYVDWYVDVLKSAMETPATDAFLAEVRAQGVESFAESQKEYVRKNRNELDSMTRAAYCGSAVDAERFAAQLRKGAAQ
ncbi:TPA: hypothetical protein OPR07_000199 [Citrobacter koseri]|uniref:hypothetical protein n=1 Tax=Citrobacter TaxID=544 RepID=UPI0008DC9F94|nr:MULTISPECIES: hypothetical protein [Citrobacter]MDM3051911.1 hypothetical protein [Citrobacter sp. CK183]MDM9064718.1 hypothetical protein [Citrobacter koseri]MDM9079005.1 hypothetical protein [Citrobacter koseri]MDM9090023.1 hypothetical protein [Citrobacter koseri]MDM9096140.1 hypothetical protein [Citrobacter koseri]